MNPTKDRILGLIRHILTLGAGALLGSNAEGGAELAGYVAGAIGLIWSWLAKDKAEAAPKAS